jgi:hypothetical protein
MHAAGLPRLDRAAAASNAGGQRPVDWSGIGREPDIVGHDKIDAIDPRRKSLLWNDCQGE